MRRAQAIFVIAALLTLPLAPLAWGMTCDSNSLPMMCCLMHKTQSAPGKHMICQCQGKAQPHTAEFTLLAPIPPGTASAHFAIAGPQHSRDDFRALRLTTISGFRSAPFEPPRA
jgi:hypothetical protein